MNLPKFEKRGPSVERSLIEFDAAVLQGIRLPYHFIAGAQDGPFICITGGVHGGEYNSIEAAYRLAFSLEPGQIRGRVLILPLVNLPAFWAKTQYVCPVDGKNLGTSFPGDPAGTFTEVLAHELYSRIFPHADAFIDLHCGDITEEMVPLAIYQQSNDARVEAATRALAVAFGLPHIVVRPLEILSRSHIGYMESVNVRDGKPSIVSEVGGRGATSEDAVTQTIGCVRRALIHLRVLRGENPPAKPPMFLRLAVVTALEAGIFRRAVNIGERVLQGQQVGYLDDLLGKRIAVLTSPEDGLVVLLSSSLAAPKEDVLVAVGRDITNEMTER